MGRNGTGRDEVRWDNVIWNENIPKMITFIAKTVIIPCEILNK